jgi:hypothetical protein
MSADVNSVAGPSENLSNMSAFVGLARVGAIAAACGS